MIKHKIKYYGAMVCTILVIWAMGLCGCYLFAKLMHFFVEKLPNQPHAHYDAVERSDYSAYGGYVAE